MPAPLVKPSRLARDVSKWDKKRRLDTAKAKAARQDANRWRALSALVKTRDGRCCRVCRITTAAWGSGDPRRWGQTHHIVYRSANGPDELWNLVWLCNACSDDEHAHRIDISGTADDLKVRHL